MICHSRSGFPPVSYTHLDVYKRQASGSAVSAVVQQALESPAFWTSFLRTAGPSYEEAKAGGASEMEAALYALAGGLT